MRSQRGKKLSKRGKSNHLEMERNIKYKALTNIKYHITQLREEVTDEPVSVIFAITSTSNKTTLNKTIKVFGFGYLLDRVLDNLPLATKEDIIDYKLSTNDVEEECETVLNCSANEPFTNQEIELSPRSGGASKTEDVQRKDFESIEDQLILTPTEQVKVEPILENTPTLQDKVKCDIKSKHCEALVSDQNTCTVERGNKWTEDLGVQIVSVTTVYGNAKIDNEGNDLGGYSGVDGSFNMHVHEALDHSANSEKSLCTLSSSPERTSDSPCLQTDAKQRTDFEMPATNRELPIKENVTTVSSDISHNVERKCRKQIALAAEAAQECSVTVQNVTKTTNDCQSTFVTGIVSSKAENTVLPREFQEGGTNFVDEMNQTKEKTKKTKQNTLSRKTQRGVRQEIKKRISEILIEEATNAPETTPTKRRSRHKRIEGGYSCETCNKVFDCYYRLDRHMQCHSDEKPCTCQTCGKQFVSMNNLRTHSKIHAGIKAFRCEICGREFSQAGNLKVHIRRHTGEKPYVCPTCGMAFVGSTVLTRHIRTHTREAKHRCEICGKDFLERSHLRAHFRHHTGEKPYNCEHKGCERAFRTASELNKHRQSHSDLMNHICPLCDKRFKKPESLKIHLRMHSGDFPFRCEVCGRRFNQKFTLTQHMKIHAVQ